MRAGDHIDPGRSKWSIAAVALLVGISIPGPASAGLARSGPAHPGELREGMFLVASPDLRDPNFARTVVLLLAYDESGAFGLVVNRPSEITLAQAVPEWPDPRASAWAGRVRIGDGGPVERSRVHLVVRSRAPPVPAAHVLEVLPGVYVTSSQAVVGWASREGLAPRDVRAFSGYAGWGPGQLDREVASQGWRLVEADSADLFERPPDELWKRLIRATRGRWVREGPPGGVRQLRVAPKVSMVPADVTGSDAPLEWAEQVIQKDSKT